MSIVELIERLRTPATPTIYSQDAVAMREAADEIERLRNLLQNGSPVVEGTIQHMAMEIAALKRERDELVAALHKIALAADTSLTTKRDICVDAKAALAKLGADKEGV